VPAEQDGNRQRVCRVRGDFTWECSTRSLSRVQLGKSLCGQSSGRERAQTKKRPAFLKIPQGALHVCWWSVQGQRNSVLGSFPIVSDKFRFLN